MTTPSVLGKFLVQLDPISSNPPFPTRRQWVGTSFGLEREGDAPALLRYGNEHLPRTALQPLQRYSWHWRGPLALNDILSQLYLALGWLPGAPTAIGQTWSWVLASNNRTLTPPTATAIHATGAVNYRATGLVCGEMALQGGASGGELDLSLRGLALNREVYTDPVPTPTPTGGLVPPAWAVRVRIATTPGAGETGLPCESFTLNITNSWRPTYPQNNGGVATAYAFSGTNISGRLRCDLEADLADWVETWPADRRLRLEIVDSDGMGVNFILPIIWTRQRMNIGGVVRLDITWAHDSDLGRGDIVIINGEERL